MKLICQTIWRAFINVIIDLFWLIGFFLSSPNLLYFYFKITNQYYYSETKVYYISM
jgi:hypothetical protein